MDTDNEQQELPQMRKSGAKRIFIHAISLLLLLSVGCAIGAALFVAKALQPVAESAQEKRVVIPQGARSSEIAAILKEQGLIRDAVIFTYYLKYKGEGSRFQAGEYSMTTGMAPDQIIGQLNKGLTVKEEVIRVTIPEGYTVSQIAEKLSLQTPWNATEFLEIINRPETLEVPFADQIPADSSIKHRLEGYLFPETYEFNKGTTEQQFIERTVQELEKKLATLPSDWQDKMKTKGLTFHQLLTISSLIEREVVVDEERPLVAGVIYNRLNKKMALQIDATVQYLFDTQKERLFEKDLQIESPYNTYRQTGLPPGPIASPSLASIRAALYPQETKYFFYVTKKDGSQRHLFAETFEQHQRNIAASKKSAN